MPICDKCGEDKIEHGFFAHQKFCKGDLEPVSELEDEEKEPVYLEPIEEDEEPVIEAHKEEVVKLIDEDKVVEPVIEVPNPDIEELRKGLGELTEEHNELLNDMSGIRSDMVELKSSNPDVLEKLELLRNKIDDIEEVQEENQESNRNIVERIENISLDYNNLRKEVVNGKASMTENLKQMMDKISQMPVEKQGVAIQQLEDFNETISETMKSDFNEMRLAIEKIYSENKANVEFLKNELEELKKPIVNPEIKELRDEIKFMRGDLEKALARDQTRAENIERTIPKLPQMIKPDKIDNSTWNDVAVKGLVVGGILLILLWIIL